VKIAALPPIALAVLLLALPATAHARSSSCSPSGDVCYGAVGSGSAVRLRLTLAAEYFTRYRLCVRGPDGRRDCRRFRVRPIGNGMYGSTVRWARAFPSRGPGTYRATWDWGSGPVRPAVTFEEGPSIRVHPASVSPGEAVRVFGLAGGCPKGDAVTLMSEAFPASQEFAGVPAVSAKVRAGDRYSVRVQIPAGRAPGRYTISARCGGGNFGVTAQLEVR
jgi:hypothetical protein